MRKKINLLSLTHSEMNRTRAGIEPVCIGPNCGCLCCYANSGGSSNDENCNTNYALGKYSPPCEEPTA